MDKKTVSLILKVLKTTISIVLVIAATVSMLGATLISVARDYLQSNEFHEEIEKADLSSVKLMVGDEKITVLEFVRNSASQYIETQLPISSLSPFTDYAVETIVTPTLVNTVVKAEVNDLIDYFLNSNVEEAEERIKNNETLSQNESLDIKNAKTPEDAIKIYARRMILQTIESASKMSSDNFIVLLSEKTVTKCVTLAVVLIIALALINIRTIFNNLIYGGAMGILYGIVIKVAQSKFDEWNVGLEDLAGYVFLKPLANAYSSNATIGFIVGIILVALFVGVYFLFKNFVNKNPEEN